MRYLAAVLLCVYAPAAFAADFESLPGTQALTWPETDGELADRLMDGAHQFVDRVIGQSKAKRDRYWQYDCSSNEAYEKSIAPNRRRFKQMIGVVDAERLAEITLERFGDERNPSLVAESENLQIHQVRWSVLDGVFSEGLLVTPKREYQGFVIAVPDADQTPEQLLGLTDGDRTMPSQLRQAAGQGRAILVPTLINRQIYLGEGNGDARLKQANQSHREWIYRQAFHMGRHIIGYEVQKVLAAVDWIEANWPDMPIQVDGVGEGALIAFYAGACDPRIDAVQLHGYFGSREAVWAEPIDRNLFGLVREFGDAEIASLIAPRELRIIPAEHPLVKDQKGDIPPFDVVQARAEIQRLPEVLRKHVHWVDAVAHVDDGASPRLRDARTALDSEARHSRLFRQLETHVQAVIRRSNDVREESFLYRAEPQLRPGAWSTNKEHSTLDPQRFISACQEYRRRFDEQAMGRFDEPLSPPNARSRKILETDKWTAYDVVLDVYPELFAWGVLVLPKDIRAGERRPVVVCQHGRNGLPRDAIDGHKTAYNDFAARLAERGFITFAPHNLYRGEDRYRWLDRKANSVGCTLFSFIIASHRQIVAWLQTQPQVDTRRIAFYGLSYGGESAVRIPPVVEDYCLSICSGDFNQWTRKVAATDFPGGFMQSIEWEMPYWNLGHTFDYAEMTYLIFPRPMMVERGHHDRVSVDPWVAHEYAKTRWLYAQFGLADKTEIEFFQGGHSINGQVAFEFLHRHLNWPGPQP